MSASEVKFRDESFKIAVFSVYAIVLIRNREKEKEVLWDGALQHL
jgi:hypothetical protein